MNRKLSQDVANEFFSESPGMQRHQFNEMLRLLHVSVAALSHAWECSKEEAFERLEEMMDFMDETQN